MKGNFDFIYVFNLNINFKVIGNNCIVDVVIKLLLNYNSSDLFCFDVFFLR